MSPRTAAGAVAVAVLLAVPPVAAQQSLVARSIGDASGAIGADRAVWFHRPAWSAKPTGEGVRVAIIDTGIDASHPDLKAHGDTMRWRDFVHGRDTPYDDNGHGTHVAGIVAAQGSFSLDLDRFYFPFGMRGLAPDVTLMVAKAMDDQGEGTDETVSDAIRWAIDPDGDGNTSDGADIINLSIGIEQPTRGGPATTEVRSGSDTRAAIHNATDEGVLVVVSAGNDGRTDGVSDPGGLRSVISVGATDGEGHVANFSNHGPDKPDLVGPGVIVSTYPKRLDGRHEFDTSNDGYTGMAGTSMAAPLVTATLALMLGANSTLMPSGPGNRTSEVVEVKSILTGTATDLGVEGDGQGRLDAFAAFSRVDQGTDEIVWWFPPMVLALVASAAAAAGIWWYRREDEDAVEETGKP